MEKNNFLKDLIKKFSISGKKEKILEDLKKSYVPKPCDICGDPMTFEESLCMHMHCSVNPKDRFCSETVFCCGKHSPKERFDFVMKRRKERKAKNAKI